MKKTILILAALGGALLLLLRKAQEEVPVKEQTIEGKSGVTWIQRWDPDNPSAFVLWAPAGSFGPHQDMPIVRVNPETNQAEAWPGAPEVAYQTAESDFGFKVQR